VCFLFKMRRKLGRKAQFVELTKMSMCTCTKVSSIFFKIFLVPLFFFFSSLFLYFSMVYFILFLIVLIFHWFVQFIYIYIYIIEGFIHNFFNKKMCYFFF